MTTYRVSAEFDLDITDWPAAREHAIEFMRQQKEHAEAEGGRVEFGGGPQGEGPEQGIARLANDDQIAVSAVVAFLLGTGAQELGGLDVGNLKHSVNKIA